MYNNQRFIRLGAIARATLFVMLALSLTAASLAIYPDQANAAISDQFWSKQLIELPKGAYDEAEADRMTGRILQIHPAILESLVYKNVKLRWISGPLTDEPEYHYLKGVVPRGWESTGLTWDSVPGVGGNPVIARIGYSEEGKGHGAYNLELHETFHAIDSRVFERISTKAAFKELFTKEAAGFFGGNRYEEVYPEEYFAETASMYYLGDETKTLLRNKMPDTYDFLHRLFSEHKPVAPSIQELETHWAKIELERLVGLRIMNGFEDGSIRPEESVSREQFIKLLMESLGAPEGSTSVSVFNDLSGQWSTKYISAALAAGIIIPQDYDSSFEPAKALTREEMAVWVARALALQPDESSLVFADTDQIGHYPELIGATVQSGIVKGMPGNLFKPHGIVTRAEAAVILNRMLDH